MEDGHFLSFATISLGIVLFFVLSLGGVFIYLFLRGPQVVQVEEKSNKSEERISTAYIDYKSAEALHNDSYGKK